MKILDENRLNALFAHIFDFFEQHLFFNQSLYDASTFLVNSFESKTAREDESRAASSSLFKTRTVRSVYRPLRSAAKTRTPCLRPSCSTTSEFAGRLKLLRGEMLTPLSIFGASADFSLVPARARPLRISGE